MEIDAADTRAAVEVQVETNDAIERVLSSLPGEDRALLSLRYLLDLSVPDVAQTMGISEGTVKSRLSRLLSRLREEEGLNDGA
jgi:RNA polymerase sigma factor (sigma-70 family)